MDTMTPGWLREEVEHALEDLQSWPIWRRKETGLEAAVRSELMTSGEERKMVALEARVAELEQQLAASEATCAQMREALGFGGDCYGCEADRASVQLAASAAQCEQMREVLELVSQVVDVNTIRESEALDAVDAVLALTPTTAAERARKLEAVAKAAMVLMNADCKELGILIPGPVFDALCEALKDMDTPDA